jgi:hypothetical protein
MNYSLDIVQGDSRFPLEIQLWERSDEPDEDHPIDLDDVEKVMLHIYFKGVLVDSIEMRIYTDAKNGILMNDFWGEVWSERGTYRVDAEVFYLDGGSKTMENQAVIKARGKGGK